MKVLLRSSGIVQLDGFQQEVRAFPILKIFTNDGLGLRAAEQGLQELVQHEP